MGIQAISSSSAAIDVSTLAQARATSASKATSQASQPATQKTGTAPPKPVASTESTSSTSSPAQIYDKRDANQDAVISYQEELLYSLKQTTDETKNQSTVSPRQLQSGLYAYQQGQQTNGTSMSSSLFAI